MTESVIAKTFNPVTNHQEDSTTGNAVAQKSTGDAGHVNMFSGGHAQLRARNLLLAADGTRSKYEWPSGANIKYLEFLATLANLQVNGNFAEAADATATGTATSGWSWANSGWATNGSLITTLVDAETLTSAATAVIGQKYTITYTIGTAALASITSGGVALTSVAVGTHSETITATTATSLFIAVAATPDASATLDNVSIYPEINLVANKVIVTIDAANDTEADANLGETGSATPTNSSFDVQFIPIPLYITTQIPYDNALSSGSLSGGRVDARALGIFPVDLWIGAN